jgi:hypothetical protein
MRRLLPFEFPDLGFPENNNFDEWVALSKQVSGQLSGGKRQWYKQRQNAAKTGHIGSHPEKGILGRGVSDD